MSTVLKLGTRKSLLAWAQSSWIAREIEKHNPGTRVELVGIETRGDVIQDISLQAAAQMTGGKEFFVAEIDQALRSGAVDLTVHSMKDLSLDRPSEFINAATPRRENPRDVALFGPGVVEKLRSGQALKIGTSSPRRVENIPAFLQKALPQFGSGPVLEFTEIRGNVNTRLGRVHEPEGSVRKLDAVILAFAGLIRLWKDEKGREELRKLLHGVRWMVLPLRECPSAPAQGALAIECRRADKATLEKIRKIHCADTEAHVALERGLLAEWGGGCHQKFGATAVSTETLQKLFFVRGRKPDGAFVDEFHWKKPAAPTTPRAWNGSEWRSQASSSPLQVEDSKLEASACFVAHWRAVLESKASKLRSSRVWVSGSASWFNLAAMGIWVEGSAENLGFEAVRATLAEPVLQLPEFCEWAAWTHAGALNEWECRAVATYRLDGKYPERAAQELADATHVFWSSATQFEEFGDRVSANAQHACGPGKTYEHLKRAGVNSGLGPAVFPSAEEWKKWINGD